MLEGKKKLLKKDFYFFSRHATEQLNTRSTMNRADVLKLLDKGLYIPVGQDKNHTHIVIYSIKDNNHYVIVHDQKNLEIITFLYVDYNNKFVIFSDPLKEIKEKTTNSLNSASNKNKKKKTTPQTDSKNKQHDWILINKNKKPFSNVGNYEVVVETEKENSNEKDLTTLFTINSTEYSNHFELLDIDNYFLKRIDHSVKQLFIDPRFISSVSLKFVGNGYTIRWAASRKFIKNVVQN